MTDANTISHIFFEDFCTAYRKAFAKLPYSINILDELHGNENFHSRFLVRLLSLKVGNDYPILFDLLRYLSTPFSDIPIETPWLSAESDRIDARIRFHTKSSVIIENKIHGAVEQPNQVDRYLANELAAKYKLENIYVLYLTRTGGTASENSLSNVNRENLGHRYKDISFKSDILPWLRSVSKNLIPKIDLTVSRQLQAALTQYIDHLEGLLSEREGESCMKNEMVKFLNESLKLADSKPASERLKALTESKNFSEKLQNYLQELEDTLIFGALASFQKNVQALNLKDVSEIKFDDDRPFGEKYSQFIIRPKAWKKNYAVGFSFDERFAKFFYGIRDFNLDPNAAAFNTALQKKFTEIFLPERNEPNPTWPLGIWFPMNRVDSDFLAQIEDNRFLTQVQSIFQNIMERTKNIPEIQLA